jgi:hypothetical protein
MFIREYNEVKPDAKDMEGWLHCALVSVPMAYTPILFVSEYGEPFVPKYVYDAVRSLNGFDSMRVCDKTIKYQSNYLFLVMCQLIVHVRAVKKMPRNFLVFCWMVCMRNFYPVSPSSFVSNVFCRH